MQIHELREGGREWGVWRVGSVVVGLLFSLELHLSLCILMCVSYTCRQYS